MTLEVLPGFQIPVASRPDLALSKLVWINKGSHKSRRDLKWIYRRSTEAEQRHLRELAEQFSLLNLLADVLSEPDEIGS